MTFFLTLIDYVEEVCFHSDCWPPKSLFIYSIYSLKDVGFDCNMQHFLRHEKEKICCSTKVSLGEKNHQKWIKLLATFYRPMEFKEYIILENTKDTVDKRLTWV